jgi:hypothetical protein
VYYGEDWMSNRRVPYVANSSCLARIPRGSDPLREGPRSSNLHHRLQKIASDETPIATDEEAQGDDCNS